MLDRALLLKELDHVARILFEDNSQSVALAWQAWQAISQDSLFAQKVASWSSSLPVPSWQGDLDESCIVAPIKNIM
jgi:hypothetical protein